MADLKTESQQPSGPPVFVKVDLGDLDAQDEVATDLKIQRDTPPPDVYVGTPTEEKPKSN